MTRSRNTMGACAVLALISFQAHADSTPDAPSKPQNRSGTKADATPKLGTTEVMNITQAAMSHIAAADRAIDQGNKKAAQTALSQSEKELAKLYNNPALGPLMTELDNAIDSVSNSGKNADGLDLAPLSTSV